MISGRIEYIFKCVLASLYSTVSVLGPGRSSKNKENKGIIGLTLHIVSSSNMRNSVINQFSFKVDKPKAIN